MKKALIIIAIFLAIFIVWKVVGKNIKSVSKQADETLVDEEVSTKLVTPGADENRTYNTNTKESFITIGNGVKMQIEKGAIVFERGQIIGGENMFKAKEDKSLVGLDVNQYPEANLVVKAVVFEPLRSDLENLVYRIDTELTLNGVTNPISFLSDFNYDGSMVSMNGESTLSLKDWNISTVPENATIIVRLVASVK